VVFYEWLSMLTAMNVMDNRLAFPVLSDPPKDQAVAPSRADNGLHCSHYLSSASGTWSVLPLATSRS
jgi:hypothetical protein